MPSVWTESVSHERRPIKQLNEDKKADVLVIGAGMAGILCAYYLKRKGLSPIVAEAARIGSGTTGNTTAKITSQHGLIYADTMRKYGVEKARQYYTVNEAALSEYRTLSAGIPCDFEEKTAYVYSLDHRDKLDREAAAYGKLGIPFFFHEHIPLPFQTAGALGLERQAQFNPMRLLHGLAQELEIYEDTFVTKIDGNRAITRKGTIQADHIILATHFPMVNIPGLYFMKMYQHRSYVIAVKGGPDVEGMYVDERQDGHSFRNYGDLLLVGGGDHRTGKKGGGYEELAELIRDAYPLAQERYAWATQDCMTLDGIPYIGMQRKATPNLYVATGFNKWGMTGSMAAAMVLSDLIAEGKSEYTKLFSPRRTMLHGQLFLNMLHAMAGWVSFGKRCPHMGCALRWNAMERTWDCPCHGSRFYEDGNIVDNPALRRIHVKSLF